MFGQYVLSLSPLVLGARGDVDGLVALLGPLEAISGWRNSELIGAVGRAIVLRETGRAAEAVPIAHEATLERLAHPSSEGALMFAEAVDCALAGGQPEAAQALLGQVDSLAPVELLPLLEAEALRARARLDALAGAIDGAEQQFKCAINLFTELATPFYLARAQLEYAELLAGGGRAPDQLRELRDESAAVFATVGAQAWLERAQSLTVELAQR
jgi:hypothetical protein